MSDLFDELIKKVKGKNLRVVFPEGDDLRILRAARYLCDKKIITPLILESDVTKKLLLKHKISSSGFEFVSASDDTYLDLLLKKRKHKLLSKEQAKKLLKDVNYQGVLLVEKGVADAMISGAKHSTAKVIRPALEIIKTKKGIKNASSFFLMMGSKNFLFADCAFIINPSADQLKDITLSTVHNAKKLGIKPKVALLSFSTKGTAKDDSINKVNTALKLIREKDPSLIIDGEIQLDAAIDKNVAKLKCPNSPLKGEANILIFPDLNSGNIGYKLVERLGGFSAVGPIVQGLKKPVNDLSRGCSVEDIIKVGIITALEVEK